MSKEDFLDHCEAFLRAGGIVSQEEFSQMDPKTVAALIVARKRIQVDFALDIARALGGDDERALLLADVDGGDAWIHHNLIHAVNGYLKK